MYPVIGLHHYMQSRVTDHHRRGVKLLATILPHYLLVFDLLFYTIAV
jgi:hypothetical protein